MADCAAILHTQPSEMAQWDLVTLYRWHQQAIKHSGDDNP